MVIAAALERRHYWRIAERVGSPQFVCDVFVQLHSLFWSFRKSDSTSRNCGQLSEPRSDGHSECQRSVEFDGRQKGISRWIQIGVDSHEIEACFAALNCTQQFSEVA